jgi:hypothetical protein
MSTDIKATTNDTSAAQTKAVGSSLAEQFKIINATIASILHFSEGTHGISKEFVDLGTMIDNTPSFRNLIHEYLETKVDTKATQKVYLRRQDREVIGRLTAGNNHEAVLKCDKASPNRCIFAMDCITEIAADDYISEKVKPVITIESLIDRMVADMTSMDNDHGVMPLDMIRCIDDTKCNTALKETQSGTSNCIGGASEKKSVIVTPLKSDEKQAISRWISIDEYKKNTVNICGYIAQRGPFKDRVCASLDIADKTTDQRCRNCIGKIATIRANATPWTFNFTNVKLPPIKMRHLFNDDCYEYSYGSFIINENKCYLFTERWILTGCPEYPPTKKTVDEMVTSFINNGKYYVGLQLECNQNDLEFALEAAGLLHSERLESRSICLKEH